MSRRDFKALRAQLLAEARSLLPQWFPAGKFTGREYVVGNLAGAPGKTLSINSQTGVWEDFATGERGSDLIALFAAKEGVEQGEAYDLLTGDHRISNLPPAKMPPPKPKANLGVAPANAPTPTFVHRDHGPATRHWVYRNAARELLGYVSRHDPVGARKQFIPWFWEVDKRRWVNAMLEAPRPLYGLEKLALNPGKPVLVVEGEKAADAAATMCGSLMVVVSPPGGSQAFGKADWAALSGRKILLWPDADQPGWQAMTVAAERLADCVAEIKVIDVTGQPDGWDAADALADGWDLAQLQAWTKNRVRPWDPPTTEEKKVTKAAKRDVSIKDLQDLWEQLGLEIGGSMRPHANLDNICVILESHQPIAGTIWYDEFREKILTNWECSPREWCDADDLRLTRMIQRELGIPKVSTQSVHDAVMLTARTQVRNEVREWLEGLKWDKIQRLPWLMHLGFGAEHSTYHQAVGKCWLIGMVARALRPGCKVDSMPILEGGQGIGKSTALRVLGGPWFTECHESITSKDFYGVLKGAWLVEVSEMHSFNKSEVERIKGIISCQVDRYRAPYGRNAEDHPRRSVFAGTTNRTDWNRDETGARRFWGVACGAVDLEWLKGNRDQLFAEAMAMFKTGTAWWDIPTEEAAAQAELRRPEDTWEDALREFLDVDKSYTMRELLVECLRIEIGKHDRRMEQRLAAAMRSLGWETAVKKTLDRRSIRVWQSSI